MGKSALKRTKAHQGASWKKRIKAHQGASKHEPRGEAAAVAAAATSSGGGVGEGPFMHGEDEELLPWQEPPLRPRRARPA